MKNILKKTLIPVVAGIIAISGVKSQDNSLKVNDNVESSDSTTLVVPNVEEKLKYAVEKNDTLSVKSAQSFVGKDTLSAEDKFLLESKNIEDLIENTYNVKKSKKISQEDKDKLSEVYSTYLDSNMDNKYKLSPTKISNLFEIKNSLDLEKEIKNLGSHIGKENSFSDDSRDEVSLSLTKVSELYNLQKKEKIWKTFIKSYFD